MDKIWQEKFEDWWHTNEGDDGSHDLGHFRRVYMIAKRIAAGEETPIDILVLLAAAYFHDVVNPPKDSDLRAKASQLSAEKAAEILTDMDFPPEKIDAVKHAIEAHSFSADIPATTWEAKIIQDADRVESLGAMGLARTLYIAGRLGSKIFHREDPLAQEGRDLDDRSYALDHFEMKLLKLPEMMQTKAGRQIAQERARYLTDFRKRLVAEMTGVI